MSTAPISIQSNTQSLFGVAPQNNSASPNSLVSGASAASVQQADSTQLSSPLTQMLSTLQQLQQSNPTEYQSVTQQIATNLQNAAQTASANGNTTQAKQLNQLATDFTNASQNGQMPNISDLAKAMAGGHHHHGHGASSSDSTSSSSSTNSSSSSSSSTNPLSQFLAAYQANATQNDALNPMSIMMNTLTSAGVTVANS